MLVLSRSDGVGFASHGWLLIVWFDEAMVWRVLLGWSCWWVSLFVKREDGLGRSNNERTCDGREE
jgi:hypothetical protein